ncbi:hypothetical protein JCM11641_003454 [Rhodosporidiobolus odoratus]
MLLSAASLAFALPCALTAPLSPRQPATAGYPLPLGAVGPLSDLQDPSVCQGRDGLLYLFASGEGIPIRTSSDGGGASSATPLEGDWEDLGLVISSNTTSGNNALSPHLVDDPSYPWYLTFGDKSDNLQMIALNRTTAKPDSLDLIELAKRPNRDFLGGSTVFRTSDPFHWYLLSTFDDPSPSSTTLSTIRITRTDRSLTDPYRAKDGGLLQDGNATILLASHEGVHKPASPSVWYEEKEGKWKMGYQYVDDSGRYQIGFNYLDFGTEDGWPELA